VNGSRLFRISSRHRIVVPGLLFWLCLSLLPWAAVAGREPGVKHSGCDSRLVVSEFGTGRVIVELPVEAGESFVIRYIHSVDHTPIFEQFRLDPQQGLVLEKTWFTMFGAGLGHWAGHGRLTQNRDWITISDIDQPLGSFILRIGALSVGHTIIYHDRRIDLSRLAPGVRALVEFRRGEH